LIASVKGTRDILPPESALWTQLESSAREILELYGFAEIRTPLFERTDLFARGVGEDTDIVLKEMYTFADRDDTSLTLRPEGTAPVVRAYLEHQLYRDSQLWKLYYLGPMFRRERPQKGRYRQFHQIGAEVLGSQNPSVEAEAIEMLQLFLERIGIKESSLLVNSIGCLDCRPRFLQALKEALAAKKSLLCEDCQRRSETNPLRVLDCKVESCQPVIESLPVISDFLDEPCRRHFEKFLEYLRERKISFQVAPRLVRGLDYYVRTTFEITSDVLGAQNTLIGGGRYDGLAEILGGPPTQGFGFALGLERIILVLQELGYSPASRPLQVFLAPLGEKAFDKATLLARDLRREGLVCLYDFESRSLKSALRLANKLKAQFVLIIGEAEVESGRYQLKRMSDGKQIELSREEIRKTVLAATA
jgi:histidyl-tRNA synthetase